MSIYRASGHVGSVSWRCFLGIACALLCLRAHASTTPTAGAISVGQSHVLALKADGSVWSWGENSDGRLGDGTQASRLSPVAITTLNNVAAISAGTTHSLALKADGTVWAWGDNTFSQLGDGTTAARSTPVQVPGLMGIISISAGGYHSLALRADGTVWAWGMGFFGAVGTGSPMPSVASPVQVTALSNIVSITAGEFNSAAIRADGTVWRWGRMASGAVPTVYGPVQIAGVVDAVSVACGEEHLAILRADGTVWCCGGNTYGELGNGSAPGDSAALVQVANLSSITQIASRGMATIALKADGTAWGWGTNYQGYLGDGTSINRSTPVMVVGLSDAIAISASASCAAALLSDGTIRQWGANSGGQSGDGTATFSSRVLQAPGAAAITRVSTKGGWEVIGLTGAGAIWLPTGIDAGLSGISCAAAGADCLAAVKNDGSVWMWGNNNYGQLGNGTTVLSSTPGQVSGLSGAIAVDVGLSHTLALKADGTVWAWGKNDFGQLGDGTTVNRSTPVQVANMAGVAAIGAGYGFSVALKSDGTVWKWGINGSGQISGLAGITAISVGNNHFLAVKNDGTVWAFGGNSSAQLGIGTSSGYATTGVQVPGLTGVVAVAAGGFHSAALKSDGTVWTWGTNSSGQLGDGTKTLRPSPVQVTGLTGVTALTAGDSITIFVRSNGSVWACGDVSLVKIDSNALRPAAIRLISAATDTDQDGMADAWEIAHFGNLSHNGAEDSDADGLADVREAALGTDPSVSDTDGDGMMDAVDLFPLDYFNGATPVLAIVGGNNQIGSAGLFNENPLDVGVWKIDGSVPYVNAPVVFSVINGGGKLAKIVGGALSDSISLRTDLDGSASVFYKQPATENAESSIAVTSGGATIIFYSASKKADMTVDVDMDGLPDAWEYAYWGSLTQDGFADFDGDGITNLTEYLLGRDPTKPAEADMSNSTIQLRLFDLGS